jgi:phosphocarrier protein HPr
MGLLSKRPASGKIQKEVTILNKLGLHARPAAMFVRAANKHRAEIWVEKAIQELELLIEKRFNEE